jgi:hypothetical protein
LLQALYGIGNIMNMTDKDWLERVTIAYREYAKQISPNLEVERFISWLYKQYGIIQPEDKK